MKFIDFKHHDNISINNNIISKDILDMFSYS